MIPNSQAFRTLSPFGPLLKNNSLKLTGRYCSTASSKSNVQNVVKEQSLSWGSGNITEEERSEKMNDLFNSIAGKYDRINDVITFGAHRYWKNSFINRIQPKPGMSLLDLAGGTGDIAIRFIQQAKIYKQQSDVKGEQETRAIVSDINPMMLEIGRKRNGVPKEISWLEGNAENLSFEDNSFDVVTIALGLRNVTHMDKVLAEAHRVLKPNGRFFCLEYSHVQHPFLAKFHKFYALRLLPIMGQVFFGDRMPYEYLGQSIFRFPNQQLLTEIIRQSGFKNVSYENLFCGVVAIHQGCKS